MLLEDIQAIMSLCFELQQVRRITRDANGNRESDTTHSMMLALVAYHVAHGDEVNPGRAAMLALIHDLKEAYAGDTPTLRPLSREADAAKTEREQASLARIRHRLRNCPHLLDLLNEYEKQETPEAHFVHMLDKTLPILTHAANHGQVLKEHGITAEELEDLAEQKLRRFTLHRYCFPNAYQILEVATAELLTTKL